MSIDVVETPDYFRVSFPYDPTMVKNFKKQFSGAAWDRDNKYWKVPNGYAVPLRQWFDKNTKPKPELRVSRYKEIPPLPELTRKIPLLLEPRDYQAKGIAYGLEKRRFLNGDAPGLGKTVQSIAVVFAEQSYPCLIVCPNTLKMNWVKEWAKFTGKRAMIMSDKVKTSWHVYHEVGMCDVFICNFESLFSMFVLDVKKPPVGKEHEAGKLKYFEFRPTISKFKSIIVDESHKLKNAATRTAKIAMGLAVGKDIRILLSGTAMVNGPKDLWPQLCILGLHREFGSEEDFVARYCKVGPAKRPGNLEELNFHLRRLGYYRREKKDVLKDLPPKVRNIWYCDISTRKEYDKAEKEFIQYLEEVKMCSPEERATKLRGGFMVKMGILRNISARGKMAEVIDYTEAITGNGEKVVLFAILKEIVTGMAKEFKTDLMIYGDIPLVARDRYVERFQNNPKDKVIVCNTKSGGVGLTLTAASRVGIVEEPYTFADLEQCEDRVHRIGQKGLSEGLESVESTIFIGKNTIDEYVHEDIVMRKKDVQDAVLGANDGTKMEIVDGLLKFFQLRKDREAKENTF